MTRRLAPDLPPQLLAFHEADVRFFGRRPDRHYRIRLAARAEVAFAKTRAGITAPIPTGYRAFVGIRRTAPWRYSRVIGFALEGTDTDLCESEAKAMFGLLRSHDNALLLDLAERAKMRGVSGK